MHRPSRYIVPCWDSGMIDRPVENDFVALYRDSNPLSYMPCFNRINWFQETIFPARCHWGKPPDFYQTDLDCQRREKRYVAVSRPPRNHFVSTQKWLLFQIYERTVTFLDFPLSSRETRFVTNTRPSFNWLLRQNLLAFKASAYKTVSTLMRNRFRFASVAGRNEYDPGIVLPRSTRYSLGSIRRQNSHLLIN